MSVQKFSSVWAPWKVGEVLGKGSFGTVYKMTAEIDGKKCVSALKHISIPLDDQQREELYAEGIVTKDSIDGYYREIMHQLRQEIVTSHNLRGHTNIVSYEDHKIFRKRGEPGYDIFIKMECLTSLSTVLASKGLTQKQIVKLGIDMCRALEILEREKMIHRDIKPSNIFIDNRGNFKLGDFGVARHMNKTISGMSVKGTYKYMAPEVFKGESVNLTVDIYSLGLVLYILLNNNRSPFTSTTAKILSYEESERSNYRRMRGEKLPNPVNADSKLSSIILKACEYKPSDRWQTAKAFRLALEKYCKTNAYLKLDDSESVFVPNPINSNSGRTPRVTKLIENSNTTNEKLKNFSDSIRSDKKDNDKMIVIIAVAVTCFLVLTIGGFLLGRALVGRDEKPEQSGTETVAVSDDEIIIFADGTTKKFVHPDENESASTTNFEKNTTSKRRTTTQKQTTKKHTTRPTTTQSTTTTSTTQTTTEPTTWTNGTTNCVRTETSRPHYTRRTTYKFN